jgi:hypothetical protein
MDGKIKDPVEACVYGCYAKADCAELEQAVCSSNQLGTLLSCYTDCTTFRCTNGNRVGLQYRCDGAQNCADGSDEAGCQTLTCTDGTVLPISKKCDYRSDCPDSADEAGCPAFVCASGQKVAPDAHCDGTSDCLDLTDETGCPSFNCANGERILDSLHCNGPNDCTDGSDEANCPPEPSIVCQGATFTMGAAFIQLLGPTGTPGNCY